MRKLLLIVCITISVAVPLSAAAPSPRLASSSEIAFPNIIRPVGRWIRKLLRIKPKEIIEGGPANVTSLTLSKSTLYIGAGQEDETSRSINVSVEAFDRFGDVITYNYVVSAGKIVGKGPNVVWDLTGVGPGTYTITAGADDGCGVCGMTKTQTVRIMGVDESEL